MTQSRHARWRVFSEKGDPKRSSSVHAQNIAIPPTTSPSFGGWPCDGCRAGFGGSSSSRNVGCRRCALPILPRFNHPCVVRTCVHVWIDGHWRSTNVCWSQVRRTTARATTEERRRTRASSRTSWLGCRCHRRWSPSDSHVIGFPSRHG